MLKGGPDAQRVPDIQRGPRCSEWPCFSGGPVSRLSGRAFFGVFSHRFRDFCVGFRMPSQEFWPSRAFGPQGPENPRA